jgi:hypothetical protein
MLRDMAERGVRITGGYPNNAPEGIVTLADVNLTAKQSSRWQKLADMLEAEFEGMLARREGLVTTRLGRSGRPRLNRRG